MYEKCFYFLLNSDFSGKSVSFTPVSPPALQLFNPHLFNFIQKTDSPTPFTEEGRDCILYERLQKRDNKVIAILYERVFI